MSIPSSPEVGKAKYAVQYTAKHSPQLVDGAIESLREAQHAASTAPLLAEIERLKGEVGDWQRLSQDLLAAYRARDAFEAEAQKLREALTEMVAAAELFGHAANDANAVTRLADATPKARKALGGL